MEAPVAKSSMPTGLKIGLMAAGAALLVAVIVDLRQFSERNRIQARDLSAVPAPSHEVPDGADGQWIVDTNRFFRMHLPGGWTRALPPAGRRMALCYRGPEGQELTIEVTRSPHDGIESLLEEIRSTESGFSVPMNVREAEHAGHPAVWRTVKLSKDMVLVLDLLADRRWHNVQLAVPRPLFEKMEPTLTAILKSYEPMAK